MIGIFDSGHGGLTILRELVKRMPGEPFLYLGDHGHAPYGTRTATDVLKLTLESVEGLFERGCTLVVLACNTASCVALRFMQQQWLPGSKWKGTHNILGIVVPTVEAATGMDWANADISFEKTERVGVFGTLRTVISNVYPIEIGKRQPRMKVTQQAIPELVEAIEAGKSGQVLDTIVSLAVREMTTQTHGAPDHIILGCTHYDLVRALFQKHLPAGSAIIHQPETVAESLTRYIKRHPEYMSQKGSGVKLLTTGDLAHVNASAKIFWKECPDFESA